MIEGIVVIIFAVALLSVSIYMLRQYDQIEKNGQETEGVVFDMDSSDISDTATSIYPIVRFLTADQQWITKRSPVSIIPGSYKKGQKVAVIYRVDSPSDFFIKSNNTRGILITIAVLGGISFVIGAYLLLSTEF